MRWPAALIILGVIALLAVSCETLQPSNAAAVLRKFCALSQSSIASVLLTPQQVEAGRVVCSAVGMRLGEAP